MGANAQTTVPSFTAGTVLTAAAQNASARTGVPVFASTVTRDAGFGGTGEKTLAEGQLCYVEGTGLQTYNGTAWVTWGALPQIFQIKTTAKTDTFTTTSTTFVDVTGLSVSITPSSTTSRILILADTKLFGVTGAPYAFARMMRDSTAIYIGDTAGNRQRVSSMSRRDSQGVDSSTNIFIDSPATTSAITYKMQVAVNTGGGTIYVNRGSDDTDSTERGRFASSITVLEIAP